MRIHIFNRRREMKDFVIRMWQGFGRSAVRERGSFFVAVSGGKTPLTFYTALARSRNITTWPVTHIFLCDEHFVPFRNKANNYRKLKESFFALCPVPGKNIHAIHTEGTAKASAKKYEEEIKDVFNLRRGEIPRFDLIMLGIGEDGHTASLLPGNPVLQEKKRLAVDVYDASSGQYRVTCTLPVINNARQVIFLVTGQKKARIIKDIVDKKKMVPASLVRPKNKKIMCILDKGAAGLLA